MDQLFNHTKEVAAAANFPSIRVMTVGQKTASSTPLQQLATIEQTWEEASPAAIGGGNWSHFSAVCWLFGRDVYTGLGGTVLQCHSESVHPLYCQPPRLALTAPMCVCCVVRVHPCGSGEHQLGWYSCASMEQP